MAARPAPALRRDPEHRVVAGVCAGIARHFGVDPLVVRVAFMAATFAGGLGVVAYGAAWVVMPAGEGESRRRLAGRPAVEVAIGAGLLVLSALLAFRALGVWFSDALVWPLVLVAAGGALLGRESMARPAAPEPDAEPSEPEPQAAFVSRTGVGVALVI